MLKDRRLFWGGLLILLTTFAITQLSHRFIYGTGHLERPIIPFLVLFGLGFLAWVSVLEGIRARGEAPSRTAHLVWILGIAIAARLLLFTSQPILENDTYRYLWDGHNVLQGTNPYLHPPIDGLNPDLSEGARTVLSRVGYPEIRTIYPPLAQGLFAVAQWISPWQLVGWQLLIFIVDLANLWLGLCLLKHFRKNLEWIALYAWSPLILKEFFNSLHLDIFAVFFLFLLALCIAKERWLASFLMLAGAVLTKLFAAALLPLLVYHAWKKERSAVCYGLIGFTAICVVGTIPFLGAGGLLFEGLVYFARVWRINDSVFPLIRAGLTALPHVSFMDANQMARIVVAGLLGGMIWKAREMPIHQGMLVTLSALFLLSPTGNPWYFTWVFPFLLILPSRPLLLLSGLLGLYYLDFYFGYRGTPRHFMWVQWVEYLPVYLWLGYVGYRRALRDNPDRLW